MNSQKVKVILIMPEHWLVGLMPTAGNRVLDVLNDTFASYLHLEDVHVFRRTDQGRHITSLPDAVVPKDKLSFIAIPSSSHDLSTKKRLNRFVEKNVFQTFLVVPGYTVRGKVHLTIRGDDSLYTFMKGLANFFPITEATVSGAGIEPLSAPVIIANKSFVNCFYVGESPPTAARSQAGKPHDLKQPIEGNSAEEGLVRRLKDAAASRCGVLPESEQSVGDRATDERTPAVEEDGRTVESQLDPPAH